MDELQIPGTLYTPLRSPLEDGTNACRLEPTRGPLGFSPFATPVASPTDATNIYEIVRNTGHARRLSRAEVPRKSAIAAARMKEHFEKVYILHGQKPVNASLDTVNKINDPSRCTDLVAFAVRRLQRDASQLGGSFPDGYYETFAKALIEHAISLDKSKPDRGIELVGDTFGSEVGESPDTLPAYHIYDAIARLNEDNGYDKVQHFVGSAVLQYKYSSRITNTLQYGKEIRDGAKKLWDDVTNKGRNHEAGFDPKDMKANNRGQAFGQELYAKYHPIRNAVFRK